MCSFGRRLIESSFYLFLKSKQDYILNNALCYSNGKCVFYVKVSPPVSFTCEHRIHFVENHQSETYTYSPSDFAKNHDDKGVSLFWIGFFSCFAAVLLIATVAVVIKKKTKVSEVPEPNITVYRQMEDRENVIVLCKFAEMFGMTFRWRSFDLSVESELNYTMELAECSSSDSSEICVYLVTVSPPASFTCVDEFAFSPDVIDRRSQTYNYSGSEKCQESEDWTDIIDPSILYEWFPEDVRDIGNIFGEYEISEVPEPNITVYRQMEDRENVIVLCKFAEMFGMTFRWRSFDLSVESELNYTMELAECSSSDSSEICVYLVTVSPPASFTCVDEFAFSPDVIDRRSQTYNYSGSDLDVPKPNITVYRQIEDRENVTVMCKFGKTHNIHRHTDTFDRNTETFDLSVESELNCTMEKLKCSSSDFLEIRVFMVTVSPPASFTCVHEFNFRKLRSQTYKYSGSVIDHHKEGVSSFYICFSSFVVVGLFIMTAAVIMTNIRSKTKDVSDAWYMDNHTMTDSPVAWTNNVTSVKDFPDSRFTTTTATTATPMPVPNITVYRQMEDGEHVIVMCENNMAFRKSTLSVESEQSYMLRGHICRPYTKQCVFLVTVSPPASFTCVHEIHSDEDIKYLRSQTYNYRWSVMDHHKEGVSLFYICFSSSIAVGLFIMTAAVIMTNIRSRTKVLDHYDGVSSSYIGFFSFIVVGVVIMTAAVIMTTIRSNAKDSDTSSFLIYNRDHNKCVYAVNATVIQAAPRNVSSKAQHFRWISPSQIISLSFNLCLVSEKIKDWVKIILLPCNDLSPVQTWECKNGTLFGLKGHPLHLNYGNSVPSKNSGSVLDNGVNNGALVAVFDQEEGVSTFYICYSSFIAVGLFIMTAAVIVTNIRSRTKGLPQKAYPIHFFSVQHN
ncbi:macrophage mannose receptor 1-like protein [Labeo rohita]|uniref:Macrophage mannose receptor 1-like protein n=1 Tax=Labeo rohita TaxID=84645 RepID=A0A498P5S9_LABRO|nr:macrophage mannose receptor 1-like protein [Labeo rohita]